MTAVPLALVFKVALARSIKTEAEYFPTLYIIPPAGDFQPTDENLADGIALGVGAIRELDPEVGRMSVTVIGEPQYLPFDQTCENLVPALERNGWRVFIGWGVVSN